MNYKIIGKYIRELNFNIPNPKTFFLLSKDISNYKISIDIKSNQIKQNIIEAASACSSCNFCKSDVLTGTEWECARQKSMASSMSEPQLFTAKDANDFSKPCSHNMLITNCKTLVPACASSDFSRSACVCLADAAFQPCTGFFV